MVPPAGADLGDPVNARKFLPVIQSDIEIERSVAGFLVCPHPEEFPIDRVAELRTKLSFDAAQAHHVRIDRLTVRVGLRFLRELSDHLVAWHSNLLEHAPNAARAQGGTRTHTP